jgi:hypothetical protein
MLTKRGLLSTCAGWLVATAALAAGPDFLGGAELSRMQVDIERTDAADGKEYTAHHGVSAGILEWAPGENQNFRVKFALGRTRTDLEERDAGQDAGESYGTNDWFYASVGASLEQDLDVGGAVLLELSYSFGKVEWEDESAVSNEYGFGRTSFVAAYAFKKAETARPYAGIAYNTYKAEHEAAGLKKEFEEEGRFSVVGGVRARSETFVGYLEGSLGAEFGLKIGLAFGF